MTIIHLISGKQSYKRNYLLFGIQCQNNSRNNQYTWITSNLKIKYNYYIYYIFNECNKDNVIHLTNKSYIQSVLLFLLMNYKFPKLTVDGIILKDRSILLIQRRYQPFQGRWALPGGFVEYGEKTENAIIREVFEETGLNTEIIQLAGVYSDPNRDPRGHTVSIVYVLEIHNGNLKSGDDAINVKFFDLKNLPDLSFDHGSIINDTLRRA